MCMCYFIMFFFFNDTATTEIYTLSLHDALPICGADRVDDLRPVEVPLARSAAVVVRDVEVGDAVTHLPDRREHVRLLDVRSEEHTSELQSRQYLVCRLLLEKKKKYHTISYLTSS